MVNSNYEIVCPVCGNYILKDEFDICRVCFWENDYFQFQNPGFNGGANHLSLNDYEKWWDYLEEVMPKLITDFKITKSKNSLWKYDKLIIQKQYVDTFKKILHSHNIDFIEKSKCISICPNPRNIPFSN